jgi:ribose 5-phosphate isomerase B
MKGSVIRLITDMGHEVEDAGSYTAEAVDYPDIAAKVAGAVARADYDYGVLICGTGIGMSIAANKVKGIRAALCHDVFDAARTREHNDANVLCLAARDNPEFIPEIINIFLATKFEGGRHLARRQKIAAMES